MFHIENEDTIPVIDYSTGNATVACDICDVTKVSFPLRIAAQFVGGGFVLSSAALGCSCGATTVFPLYGEEPMSKILSQLFGFQAQQP